MSAWLMGLFSVTLVHAQVSAPNLIRTVVENCVKHDDSIRLGEILALKQTEAAPGPAAERRQADLDRHVRACLIRALSAAHPARANAGLGELLNRLKDPIAALDRELARSESVCADLTDAPGTAHAECLNFYSGSMAAAEAARAELRGLKRRAQTDPGLTLGQYERSRSAPDTSSGVVRHTGSTAGDVQVGR